MNSSAHNVSSHLRLGWRLVLLVLLLQFVSRYLPSPQAVWVADDWANAVRSSFYASHAEAARIGLQDPNRPLSMAAVEVGYRVFGERAWVWTLVSLAANVLVFREDGTIFDVEVPLFPLDSPHVKKVLH